MLNSTACRSKTERAPAGAPCCEKSSGEMGLMQDRSLRYSRAYETSKTRPSTDCICGKEVTEEIRINLGWADDLVAATRESFNMFVRIERRFRDGTDHGYWSVVEELRVRHSRAVQHQVLHLREINESRRAGWCRVIEILEGKPRSRQAALNSVQY